MWISKIALLVTTILTLSKISESVVELTEKGTTDAFRIVCYYGSWASSRPGIGRFLPENINPFLCTHVLYAFASIGDLGLKPLNETFDIKEGGYARINGLKKINKNLKTALCLGGWNEGSVKFASIAADPIKRRIFIKNCIKYLRQHNFNGFEIDWQFPNLKDRHSYSALIKELREGFEIEALETNQGRLRLAITLPTLTDHVSRGYDIPYLAKYVDCMHALTYNYHTEFEPLVNHHSKLYGVHGNLDYEINANYTIEFYLASGAVRRKLDLGIPTYGKAYNLSDPNLTDLGSPASGPGLKGDLTQESGVLSYFEICRKIKDEGWIVKQPYPNAMGQYAYKGNQWVGYDDENIMRKKGEYVAKHGLGGLMFWLMEYDDFHGYCGGKQFPLIEAAKDGLLNTPRYIPEKVDDGSSMLMTKSKDASFVSTRPAKLIEDKNNNLEEVNEDDNKEIPIDELRVICYYGSWAASKTGIGRFTPDDIDPFLCTHILYAFGRLTDTYLFEPANPVIDIEQGGYANFTGLKNINKNLKTFLSLRIENRDSGKFASVAASAAKRSIFIRNSIVFLRKHNFDGLEFHWKYPNLNDRRSYSSLIKELREGYERESIETGIPRLLLAITLPSSTDHINRGYDIPLLTKYVDCMHPLTYDYHDVYEPMVNHHSQLYSVDKTKYSDFEKNTNYTMSFYVESGAYLPRLAIGLPTFGRTFTLSNPDFTDIGSPASGPGIKSDQIKNENGILPYSEICRKIKEDGWKVVHPYPNAMGPYAYKGDQWVGYDDEDIMRKKGEYVAKSKFGGMVFWLMEYDDFHGYCGGKRFPLIEAAKEGLISAAKAYNAEIEKFNSNEKEPLPLGVIQTTTDQLTENEPVKTTRNPWAVQETISKSSPVFSSNRKPIDNKINPVPAPQKVLSQFGSVPNLRPTQIIEEKYPDEISLFEMDVEKPDQDAAYLNELRNFLEGPGGIEILRKVLNIETTTPASQFTPFPNHKRNTQQDRSEDRISDNTQSRYKEESTSKLKDSVSSLFDAEEFKKSKILNVVFNIDFQ